MFPRFMTVVMVRRLEVLFSSLIAGGVGGHCSASKWTVLRWICIFFPRAGGGTGSGLRESDFLTMFGSAKAAGGTESSYI